VTLFDTGFGIFGQIGLSFAILGYFLRPGDFLAKNIPTKMVAFTLLFALAISSCLNSMEQHALKNVNSC
jgi:hypothetical protein